RRRRPAAPAWPARSRGAHRMRLDPAGENGALGLDERQDVAGGAEADAGLAQRAAELAKGLTLGGERVRRAEQAQGFGGDALGRERPLIELRHDGSPEGDV